MFTPSLEAQEEKENKRDSDTTLTAVQKFARYFEFRDGKNWVFIPVPTAGYSPETGFLFGMANQVLYRKKGDTTSTASNLNLAGFYTLKKQFFIMADWNGYFNDDNLIMNTYTAYSYFPLQYYGIGNSSDPDPVATYAGKNLVVHAQANMRLTDVLWIGPALDINTFLDNKFADIDADSDFDPEALTGYDGFVNIGIGGTLKYDARDHRLYTRKGIFFEFGSAVHPKFLGSSTNNFSMSMDYRHFFSPRKGLQTFGWQARFNSQFGDVPFQALSSIGGSKWMRGYYSGRYRDLHSIFLQTEYRFPIINKFRIYGTAFMGIGDVFTNPDEVILTDLKASIGAGLRYMLDKKTRTTIRFDYARSREGDNGYYIEVLEAF